MPGSVASYSRRDWAIGIGVWSALATLSVLQTALYLEQRGQAIDWRPLVIGRALDWYTCLAVAPIFIWIVRRYALTPRRRALGLALIVLAAAAFVPVKYAVLVPMTRVLAPPAPRTVRTALVANFFTEMLFLISIALAIYAVELYRRVQQSQLEQSRLGSELARARLDALSLQLQPHFLFNTLNAAVALIRHDARAAEDMLTDVSEMLHATLGEPQPQLVPLERELDDVARYARIMTHRFGTRLFTVIDASPPARLALVPWFVLQPLVENAIEHGLARCQGPGRVHILANADRDRLRMEVRDSCGGGAETSEQPKSSHGIGLSNTRRRLEAHYGGDFTLVVTPHASGTSVAINVPYRTA
jgi:LytS/YehU family sensor histidine kinase